LLGIPLLKAACDNPRAPLAVSITKQEPAKRPRKSPATHSRDLAERSLGSDFKASQMRTLRCLTTT